MPSLPATNQRYGLSFGDGLESYYVPDVYIAIDQERWRAHQKHDMAGGSMERRVFDDPAWLPVLVEEVGEVARALCEYRHLTSHRRTLARALKDELIQVGAMAAAWIDAIDGDRSLIDGIG